MPDSHHTEVVEVERPMSISHLVHTLGAYAPVILLSAAAVALIYIVIAVSLYVFAPAQRVTTQKFRLDFEGASDGKYPNGLKFSSSDITSTPILLTVFKNNHLDRFTTFPNFSRAVFVLESNSDYERLAADYQARLSDPKLSAIDRERILREWQAKAAAVSKSDYALNWLRTHDTAGVPEAVVRKALLDTLSGWARYVTNEQHVLRYRLNVYSAEMIGTGGDDSEPIVAIQVLRSKIYKVLQNIDDLRLVPGSELLRSADGTSLEEMRLRLEEIVRFRLEPLTGRVSTSGLIANRAATMRFLESQLAYDQRQLKSAQDRADFIRQSLAVYTNDQRSFGPESAATTTAAAPRDQARLPQRSDSLMPQISESFLDRLMTLTSQSGDVQYRQRLVDDYRRAAEAIIPAQQAASYDQEVVNLVRNTATAPSSVQAAEVNAEIAATQHEVKQLVGRVNEIYGAMSRNLNPARELYTLTSPPVARTEHARSLSQLALYGVALLALSLPVIIVFCLIHARMREEEASEPHVTGDAAALQT